MRCFNVNRPDPDEPEPKKKKLDKTKLSKTAKHDYPEIPACDDVSYERNLTRLSKELQKTKPNNDALVDRHSPTDVSGLSVRNIQYLQSVKNFHS